jgi:hypothetical protein
MLRRIDQRGHLRCRSGDSGRLHRYDRAGNTAPHQHCTVLSGSQLLSLNKFDFSIFQGLIIKIKLPLEGTVGQTSATL